MNMTMITRTDLHCSIIITVFIALKIKWHFHANFRSHLEYYNYCAVARNDVSVSKHGG